MSQSTFGRAVADAKRRAEENKLIAAKRMPDFMTPFQVDLYALLQEKPCMRTAYWVYDSKGYMGKSTFTIFAEVLLDALILTQARKKDLLYWIVHLIDIMKCYVFDLLRLMGTHKTINDVISLAEDLKNGYVFNTKYFKRGFQLNDVHVLVLSSNPPPPEKLSRGRWKVLMSNNVNGYDRLVEAQEIIDNNRNVIGWEASNIIFPMVRADAIIQPEEVAAVIEMFRTRREFRMRESGSVLQHSISRTAHMELRKMKKKYGLPLGELSQALMHDSFSGINTALTTTLPPPSSIPRNTLTARLLRKHLLSENKDDTKKIKFF